MPNVPFLSTQFNISDATGGSHRIVVLDISRSEKLRDSSEGVRPKQRGRWTIIPELGQLARIIQEPNVDR